MIDKLINWLIGAKADLNEFDEHVQNEIVKYSNKQVKKTAVVCGALGLIIGFAIGKLV